MAAVDRADAELGAKIAAARFARGLTQTQLARRAGVDRTYITAIEGGDLPGSEDVRQQILNILELDPEEPLPAPTERLCLWCGQPTGSKRASVYYCCTNHQKRGRRAGLHTNGHAHATATNGSAADHRSNGATDPQGDRDDHHAAETGPPGTALDGRTTNVA